MAAKRLRSDDTAGNSRQLFIFPRFIRRMKALGNTGKDVNKRGNIQVAESGGIVAVFSFSLAMFVIAGLASITNFALTPGHQPGAN